MHIAAYPRLRRAPFACGRPLQQQQGQENQPLSCSRRRFCRALHKSRCLPCGARPVFFDVKVAPRRAPPVAIVLHIHTPPTIPVHQGLPGPLLLSPIYHAVIHADHRRALQYHRPLAKRLCFGHRRRGVLARSRQRMGSRIKMHCLFFSFQVATYLRWCESCCTVLNILYGFSSRSQAPGTLTLGCMK